MLCFARAPEALPRAVAPRAAGALPRGGATNGPDGERVDSALRVEVPLLRQARVDDIADPRNGEGRLCDVGRQNHLVCGVVVTRYLTILCKHMRGVRGENALAVCQVAR